MNQNFNLLLAAATPPVPAAPISLTDALLVIAIGGLAVAAYQLRLVLGRLDALERRLTGGANRSAPAPAAPPAVPTPSAPLAESNGSPSPELLAVLVAAVHAAVGRRARIVSIAEGGDGKQAWSMEGRRQIFASHQVR